MYSFRMLDTFKENSTTLIDEIVKPLNEAKIPFSSTHGVSLVVYIRSSSLISRKNHDNEPNITHVAEILREQAVAPLSYTRMSPNGVGGEGGPGNYWVPVSVIPMARRHLILRMFSDLPRTARSGIWLLTYLALN